MPSSTEPAAGTQHVDAVLFGKLRPGRVELSGPSTVVLTAVGGALHVGSATVPQPLELPRGEWTLVPRAGDRRPFRGALRAYAEAGRVVLVGRFELEDYVAEAVASETVPWAPAAALRAQAIVTRSWVRAAGRRHARGHVCDQSHCQVLLRQGVEEHRPACRAAARATERRGLLLPNGRVALAVYHAACGGMTEDPALVFGSGRPRPATGPHPTGAASVPDPGCPLRPWKVTLPLTAFEASLADVLELPAGEKAGLDDVELVRGPGGRIVTVRDRRTGRFGSGDALARALDRAHEGVVWSARFQVRRQDGQVVLDGNGYGHGVGLCQTGAAVRARGGKGEEAIVRAYFPGARLGTLP